MFSSPSYCTCRAIQTFLSSHTYLISLQSGGYARGSVKSFTQADTGTLTHGAKTKKNTTMRRFVCILAFGFCSSRSLLA